MKRVILTILVISLMLIGLVACGSKPKEDGAVSSTSNTSKPALKVALDASYRPMEWMKGDKIVGFDADIITAVAKEMGRTVELKNVIWDEIFDKLYANEYDVIASSVTINDDRKKTMNFSDSYFDSKPIILTRKSENVKSVKDLSGKKVAIQKGTTAGSVLSKNAVGIDIKEFDAGTDALSGFADKQVNAVILDSPVVLDYVKQKNDPEYQIVEDNVVFQPEKFGIAVNKGSETLATEINTALGKIKANGEYQKVYNKYFGTN